MPYVREELYLNYILLAFQTLWFVRYRDWARVTYHDTRAVSSHHLSSSHANLRSFEQRNWVDRLRGTTGFGNFAHLEVKLGFFNVTTGANRT